MVLILSSHFFSISYQMAYSLFWGVDLFLKTFPIIAIQSPRSSEFDAVRRIFVLEKKRLLVSISIFASLIMVNEMDAEMADI